MTHLVLRAAMLAVMSVCVGLWPTIAMAQQVGQASAIKNAAFQQAPAQAQAPLNLQDPIIWKANLSTPDNGALEVKFLDDSRLSMGANSTLTIDEFSYSGPGGAGQQTLQLTKGLFRFVSGQVPKDKVKLDTPAVSIGIRGTILRAQVDTSGRGQVSVDFGPNGEVYEVVLISKKTGKVLVLSSGQKIGFDGDGVFEGVTDGTIEGCGP